MGLLLAGASPAYLGAKDEWGPWRHSSTSTAGIEFRTECVSDSSSTSTWRYQFRSRHDLTVDFVWHVEHETQDAQKNEFGKALRMSIQAGATSRVYTTRLAGACGIVKEPKVEILCDMVPGWDEQSPCYKDAEPADHQ